MADILVGYTYSRGLARYRDLTTGRFVSRNNIVSLLETQVDSTERRLGALVNAAHEGRVSPSWFAETMRTELRRAHLQNRALGMGGFDRLDASNYGAVGRKLRDDYARVARLAQDLADGNVTLPQALQRVRGYAGNARLEYWEAERAAMRGTGRSMEARRMLNPAEHCQTCIWLASKSWRPMDEIPVPGDGSTECGSYDRCSIEYRTTPVQNA